jgi:hypothetical protein
MAAILAAMSMMVLLVLPVSADTTFDIEISGAAEVCDDPATCGGDGTGTAVIDVVTDTDEVCFDLDGADVTLPIAAAHIHEAPEGEAGPVVVPLFTDPEAAFPISGCVTADAGLVAEIEANPENYYVNLHNADFPAGALRGQLAAAARDVTVQVMKHNCADVTTMAEFEAVEARAATNPTTPDAAFGTTVETVLECPTVVLDGDAQTAGAVAGGTSTFDFTVADGGSVQTLSTDSTYTQAAACETDVMYDANRNGDLDADVCLDLSDYDFTTADGTVTVTETVSPSGMSFGALRFTPGSGDEASLVSAANGVIVLDTTGDEDGSIMLHVYNFAAAAEPTPAPAASELPDAAVNPPGTFGSSNVAILFGIMALASIGFLGFRTAAVRRNR